MRKFPVSWIVIVVLFAVFQSSCIPKKKLIYLNDIEKPNDVDVVNIRSIKTIQPFDNIYIRIYSIDERTAAIFGEKGSMFGNQQINLISYNVDQTGHIDFPFIGAILVKDLTLQEAKEKIEESLNQYLNNTTVSVKFVSNYVTILGEVRGQGTHPFFEDQINIFQALGLAGGIGDYGDKKSVRIIRKENNTISVRHIDLTRKAALESEYYYIIPNDIIMVEPINMKFRSMQNLQYTYLTMSVITTSLTVLFYFKK